MQSNFWAGTKYLDQRKTFLGPVKGQGIILQIVKDKRSKRSNLCYFQRGLKVRKSSKQIEMSSIFIFYKKRTHGQKFHPCVRLLDDMKKRQFASQIF